MTDLTAEQTQALIARLTTLADDDLLLSHRDAEWTGHAPILEEDIALANIAQDELGHAMGWLELRKTLDGSDPDVLAFRRGPEQFCNSALTELPKSDWAFTMVRQYLFDAWEALWQDAAKASPYGPLAQAAALALREKRFHLQHTAIWVERLALGTPESERRTREALNAVWPYALGLFEPLDGERAGIDAGLLPDPTQVKARWLPLVTTHFERCGMTPPNAEPVARGTHTEHLAPLLTEFQDVNRQYAEVTVW
ncbi:phenylacetate-CoA oxygenase subunit PaaC [Deinococcus detaillensis]|uniref:Phenylacetate-CoA oxygenase subunit PaaC n=1 Tax=Deinococcus detaillensis TaxID=2592048 RepID=A0A553V562_9DEIO|nr:1,2-phenylacetyl-CoA epoxidase subunit PaaC [Deinococcus detaillensis]TSA87595.1 phenylacetate-CoA oxygenase subunit PaaC [Deinococcus detaillensis]